MRRALWLFLGSLILWASPLLYAAPAQPQKLKIIKEIKILGTKNFKVRSVRELIKSRPKDFYSEKALEEDVREILNSGNFESADFAVEDVEGGYRATFTVKERALVKKIDFTGNKKIGKSKMKEEISLKLKEGFDAAKMANDTQKILSLYGEKGYPDCKVEPFTTFDDALNQVSINFVIKEGNRVLIDTVEFEGNTAFTTKKLRRVMKETKRKKVYNSEKLKGDRELVELFYKNNGYAKAELGETKIAYNADRTKMTVTIPVKEGQRYVIGTFEFIGQTLYNTKELMKSVEMKTGKIYSQDKYDETNRNLRELYLEKGYLNARIEPEEVPDPSVNRINYRFRIDEGSIFYIDRVYIEGNKKTKEKVFRREVMLKPGDPFSSSKIRRSQEKILNLGFIDDVKPDIQPGREADKVDLVMDIVEGKPGSLSAGAGYSSNDGLVGQIQLSHSNIFGLAQRLNLMWEFGSRKQNYEIGWTEPWAFDKPVSVGVDVFNTLRYQSYNGGSSADIATTRLGGNLRIGPRFSDIYTLQMSYALVSEEQHVLTQEFVGLVPEETRTKSSFTTELIRDTRDYYFDASRGNRNSISVETAGSVLQGNTHLVKSIFNTSWFWTMFRIGNYPFVFSLNGRFGGVQEFKPSDNVPYGERFWVGGADSVRGYQSRGEIGAINGGRVFTVMNAEYKIPLYVENKRRILQLVLFADAGGTWNSGREIYTGFGASNRASVAGVIDSENERYMKGSVGFGLRITTPVFPIRLDWGYGLNHRPGEDISQIHFTLGNLF